MRGADAERNAIPRVGHLEKHRLCMFRDFVTLHTISKEPIHENSIQRFNGCAMGSQGKSKF